MERSLRLTVLGFEECGLAGASIGEEMLAADAYRALGLNALTGARVPWACGIPG